MAAGDDHKLHVVVFPWLAFGHMMPFLELSKSLAKRGHRISYLATPRNIARLPAVPLTLSSLVHFIPINLPPSPGLPADAEATSDLPPSLVPHLKVAFDGLEAPFADFLANSSPKPDWIIFDFAQHWLPTIAAESDIPCVFFSVFIAAALSFFGPRLATTGESTTVDQLTAPPPWVPFPSKVAYRHHEALAMVHAYRRNASGVSDAFRMGTVMQYCTAVAPRSCREFEADWLELLAQLLKKPVIPVGLLPPPSDHSRSRNSAVISTKNMELSELPFPQKQPTEVTTAGSTLKIMEWLDRQAPQSAVYVAFGSEAELTSEIVCELALGLEHSELSFLWVLRKPAYQFLPEEFEDRTSSRGVIARGWVPQLEVLAHPSVGGFLTHCGWSSVIESLQLGKPLVLLPIFGDQGLNTRVMEEKRIGVEVHRDEESGSISREAVSRALRMVVVEEEGEAFREKAREMREIFGDEGCHERYVDGFVEYLCTAKKTN